MKHSAYIVLAAMSLAAGCGRAEQTEETPAAEIAAQYRDSTLLMQDVESQLPPGISEADSARLRQSIVDEWIDGLLIEDLAASQIDDYDRIERLTADYRRSLIAESYRRKTRAKGVQPVDMKSVRNYYRRHMRDMRLERPIVKGLFIKVPTSSRHLDDIRLWMRNPGPETYDALENIEIKENATFRFFADRWVNFDALSGEIPYRFGDADRFVAETSDFETEHNGNTYILHIAEHRGTGDLMPEEYAAPLIEERMKSSNLEDYEAALIKALRKTAIEKKILKVGTENK